MANVLQTLATSIFTALIRPFSRFTQSSSPVAQYETLELDPATLLLTEDKANARQVLSVVGGSVSSVVGTSPMILVSTTTGVSTISCNGAQAATGLALCQRAADGSVCGTYFTTATSAVASAGVLRLPVGDGSVIAIKGATHASVDLLSMSGSGTVLVLGDGVEITTLGFQAPVSWGVGVTPGFTQPQPSGTGTTAGARWTWTGQKGQNVASGANNDGGSFAWAAGLPGTGGSGGAQGTMLWQAGGALMTFGTAAGLATPTATFGTDLYATHLSLGTAVRGSTAAQICLDIAAGGTVDLIEVFSASTDVGPFLVYASSIMSFNPSNTFGMHFVGTSSVSTISLDVGVAGIQIGATSALIGFAGATPIARPAVTGDRAGNAALASLLTNAASLGLLTDSTTNATTAITTAPGTSGNVLTSTGSAWASSAPAVPSGAAAASLFFALSVTLTGGAKTQASGKTLTNAIVVAVLLGTPSTAVGSVRATISGNSVIVTSYTAGAVQAITDASTYIVMLVGAV